MKSQTHLECVGFSLHADRDLRVLADALRGSGLREVEVNHPVDNRWDLRVEAPELSADPEPAIAGMLDVIGRLDGEPLQLWNNARGRSVDIGYKSGAEPWHLTFGLSHALLSRLDAIRASLTFTLIPRRGLRWWRRREDWRYDYLNTDFELRSNTDLTPLADLLDENGWSRQLLIRTEDREWLASYETGEHVREPELTLITFLDVIESLGAQSRAIRSSCHLREFDLGYDGGDGDWLLHNTISHKTLHRAVAIGASLRFSIYGRPTRSRWPVRWLRRRNA